MSTKPTTARDADAHDFLTTFASVLHVQPTEGTGSTVAASPSARRKRRRRLRPISLTASPASERSPQTNGFAQQTANTSLQREPHEDGRLGVKEKRLSTPTSALRGRAVSGESPFLRPVQSAAVESKREAHSVAALKGTVEADGENTPVKERVKEESVQLSHTLKEGAVIHATHIRAVADEGTLFLEALQSLHQLSCASFPNDVQHRAASPIHHASASVRAAYCQAVLAELRPILRTFPIPIQRALKKTAHEGHFPHPGTRSWVAPHPPRVSFRLLQEECSDVKPMSNRLNHNLEIAWDALLDMLRTYCGHKKEAAGSFSEEKLQSFMCSLHPCNMDIFASRFVNLLSTYTINAQQPTHIRLLDERLNALSTSSNAANHTGVTLHRIPPCVLVAFDDVPAHKFFARFLTSVDSARLNAAFLPRFLARVLQALNKVSAVGSNHEFCDAVLEARLYARFLAVVMHTMNWSHSPFVISGSSSSPESLPRQNRESGKEKVTDSGKPQVQKPQVQTKENEQASQIGDNEKGASSGKQSSWKKTQQHTSQPLRPDETPGLGSHALQWRACHLSALWQSVININELITSAVSSKQTTAVVAAAAVADVLLRFGAIDPVAKSSTWFQNGLSAMKKLRIIDQTGELHMPLVQFLKTDLLTCDQIDAKDVEWRRGQPFDDKYVLQCDANEWSTIGNMRLLQECCTSLARFRKNLAESSDTKLQKTASRRITPQMKGTTDSPSPLHDRFAPGTNGMSKKGGQEGQEGQEDCIDQDTQERFRREFLSRLDSRLLELMQIVMSSRPNSEEDARKKYSRVAKTLYSDVPVTVRAVAAHICGHQVQSRLKSEQKRTASNVNQ